MIAAPMAASSTPGESVDSLTSECIRSRLDTFVEEARKHRAKLRIEVEVLDDDCGQTVQIVLWKTPDGTVSAEGLLADHESVSQEVEELQRAHPEWSERSVCDALPLRESETAGADMSTLDQLAEGLQEMLLHPVLEPLLIIHGIQYEIRIESGISESTFSFHAPGYPRPSADQLHPLDLWSQELRHLLDLRCGQRTETDTAKSVSSESHER